MKRKLLYIILFGILFVFCNCSTNKYSSQNFVEVSINKDCICIKTDTCHKYYYQIRIIDNILFEDSVSGYRQLSLNKLLKNNVQDKNGLAYHMLKNDMRCPINVNIESIVDTSFFYKIEIPQLKQATSCIIGKCAHLNNSIDDKSINLNIKKWAYQTNNHLEDSLLLKFKQILSQLNKSLYTEYTTSQSVPLVNKLEQENYKVESDMQADYYYLYATCSQQELDKFVEDMVVNGFPNSKTTPCGIFKCNTIKNKTGYKVLLLIGIDNKDWSYQICPLGLVVTDLRAPTFELIGESVLKGNYYNYIDLKGNLRILLPSNKPLVDGFAYVNVPHWDGNGVECNVTFNMSFGGDAKYVTIKRTKDLCYHYGGFWDELRPENKTISLSKVKNPYIFTYKLHLENGDNIIPLTVEDYHGNKRNGQIVIRAEFVRNGTSDINIDNNIDIYN